MTDVNKQTLETAKQAFENFDENSERFKHEYRVRYNSVTDTYDIAEALFFDDELVGSVPVIGDFYSKDDVIKSVRNIYHSIRRNMIMLTPTENPAETSPAQ